jgi:hypothetical protein
LIEKANMKNFLIQYKGGGYDGCIWEWNFFLYDNEGKFHNLMSTGSLGIKDEAQALKVVNNSYPYDYGTKFGYNLENDDGINEFQKENNEGIVVYIVNLVNKLYKKNLMWWECDFCHKKVYDGGTACGYVEAGGIVLKATEKICDDCSIINCCSHCGEYFSNLNEDGICENCEESEC